MVGTLQPPCLPASEAEGRRHHSKMNRGKGNITDPHSMRWAGWRDHLSLRLPVAGEVFLLTSPLIERAYRKLEVQRAQTM